MAFRRTRIIRADPAGREGLRLGLPRASGPNPRGGKHHPCTDAELVGPHRAGMVQLDGVGVPATNF
jgi:hypothetical protein